MRTKRPTFMNAVEYEHHVADTLRSEGWTATVTPPAGDGGVDVIAERRGMRLAVQAKMYGASGRSINAQIVHQLFGAGVVLDCEAFMIATDGSVAADAQRAADKLGVAIRRIEPCSAGATAAPRGGSLDFSVVWDEHVALLEGATLHRADGSTNQILKVDGGGIVRRTSSGNSQRLEIEIFRWAIERLLAGETVTRKEINERFVKRGSSGIVLILLATGLFEKTKVGRLDAVVLAR